MNKKMRLLRSSIFLLLLPCLPNASAQNKLERKPQSSSAAPSLKISSSVKKLPNEKPSHIEITLINFQKKLCASQIEASERSNCTKIIAVQKIEELITTKINSIYTKGGLKHCASFKFCPSDKTPPINEPPPPKTMFSPPAARDPDGRSAECNCCDQCVSAAQGELTSSPSGKTPERK